VASVAGRPISWAVAELGGGVKAVVVVVVSVAGQWVNWLEVAFGCAGRLGGGGVDCANGGARGRRSAERIGGVTDRFLKPFMISSIFCRPLRT
jgi:hypothetical protein